ncbi:MAG: hypothetical protein ABW364_19690 [Rhodococcus fascians]
MTAGTDAGPTPAPAPEHDVGDGAAFFDGDEGRYVPRPHARSPWSENLVHGRLVSGLMRGKWNVRIWPACIPRA